MPEFRLCAVVDDNPRFYCEAVVWAECALRYVRGEDVELIAFLLDEAPAAIESALKDLGIETRRRAARFSIFRHMNKLLPFFEPDAESPRHTIVTDCDVFVVRDLSVFADDEYIRLPPINAANPPLRIFETLFGKAGLGGFVEPGLALMGPPNRETYAENASSGVILMPRKRLSIVHRWVYWAEWLIAHVDLLERWATHVSQVSFSLAMRESGDRVRFLPPQANLILHLLQEAESIYAFHITSGHIPDFADLFRTDKTLESQKLPLPIRPDVEKLNVAIASAVARLKTVEAAACFLPNFLSPAWRRPQDSWLARIAG